MRVCIVEHHVGSNSVVFSSEVGSGVGRWVGEEPPGLREYDVELELPDSFSWATIELDPADPCGLRGTDSGLQVVARVADYGYDGVATLAVGNWTLSVDTDDEPSPGIVGRKIRFVAERCDLYPYRL